MHHCPARMYNFEFKIIKLDVHERVSTVLYTEYASVH